MIILQIKTNNTPIKIEEIAQVTNLELIIF